jgi:hypothetical protein
VIKFLSSWVEQVDIVRYGNLLKLLKKEQDDMKLKRNRIISFAILLAIIGIVNCASTTPPRHPIGLKSSRSGRIPMRYGLSGIGDGPVGRINGFGFPVIGEGINGQRSASSYYGKNISFL